MRSPARSTWSTRTGRQIGGQPCHPGHRRRPRSRRPGHRGGPGRARAGHHRRRAAAGTRAAVIFSSGFAEQDAAGPGGAGPAEPDRPGHRHPAAGAERRGVPQRPRRGARLVQPDRGLQPGPDPPGAPAAWPSCRRAAGWASPCSTAARRSASAPASWSPPATSATSTRWRSADFLPGGPGHHRDRHAGRGVRRAARTALAPVARRAREAGQAPGGGQAGPLPRRPPVGADPLRARRRRPGRL